MTLTPLARGDLWDSNGWQLTDILTGTTGYDSNLTLSHDGPGDSFIAVNPTVTLARRDSSSELQLTGGATHTEFLHNRQPRETDLAFETLYAYPFADGVIPLYSGSASWVQSSEPNPYLGARVRYEQLTVTGTGFLPLSGKLGLRGTTDYGSFHYDSNMLSQTQRVDAFVGLAYQREGLKGDAQTEFSLNIGGALGQSTANDPVLLPDSNIHSREYYITAKMEGQITDKISGNVFAGFGWADYSGDYTSRNSLPVGGADLTWTIDPVRTLELTASSGPAYSPDGFNAEVTQGSLTYTQTIADVWQYNLTAGPTDSYYSRDVHERTDVSWAFGTEFAYEPSVRFRIFLDLNYTTQRSDIIDDIFTRKLVSLGSAYRF
jgi:hypothetical protein